ncbi:MAG: thiamine pyrophosphate-binding protein [Deltaproteobacteria bacterium]|nr:thiamine pyrophosphate-binding protein [bacterium]MCB9487308.1 thiamine pyrophosphate-binding protein [Deltaproteobacteria bacterium]
MANTEKISGGGLVSRMLAAEGVEVVFGIIDGTYFGFYSTLGDNDIALVTPRHESSGVHMAAAYARLTGKLGVCMASNGPGVANVLPGVAVENSEGNRVLLVTSSRRPEIVYPDRGGTFQCWDQVKTISGIAKLSVWIPSFDRIPEIMRRALRVCYAGRPGVVHVDIPESVMNGKFEYKPASVQVPVNYRRVTPIKPDPEQVKQAADLLAAAPLPMIHAGSGVLHACATKELQELAEFARIPVMTSWAARGAIPESSDCAVSMVTIDLQKQVRNEADLVLGIGTRFGETDWWAKPPYWRSPSEQKLIQVDIDDEMMGMNKPMTLGIVADAKEFIVALAKELKDRADRPHIDTRNAKLAEYKVAREKSHAELDKKLTKKTEGVHSAAVAKISQKVFGDDAVIVIDGGNTAVWTNFYHQANVPQSLLGTPKLGHLGAGVPQALGAKVARPDKPVYCVIGDGAMGMQPQEIETAVRNGLAVTYLVLCDKAWGMVKMNQQFTLKPLKTLIKKSLSPEETINTDLGEIAWDDMARSMGAHGERVKTNEELEPALRRCIESGKPAVVHVDVDPVVHMWAPALKTFKDMHLEPKGE